MIVHRVLMAANEEIQQWSNNGFCYIWREITIFSRHYNKLRRRRNERCTESEIARTASNKIIILYENTVFVCGSTMVVFSFRSLKSLPPFATIYWFIYAQYKLPSPSVCTPRFPGLNRSSLSIPHSRYPFKIGSISITHPVYYKMIWCHYKCIWFLFIHITIIYICFRVHIIIYYIRLNSLF